jgi:hypothetical protein
MAFQPTTEKLVDRLIELSRSQKLPWQETGDERAFVALLPKFSVAIKKVRGTAGDYTFRVVDDFDRLIDEVTASQSPDLPQDGSRKKLGELYELARRNAVRADDALSDLLASLEKIG